jgi:oligoribonuclease
MLAFLDLETTHRQPRRGSILEIAYIITDDSLNHLASYTQNVRPLPGFDQMEDEVVERMHTDSGLLAEIAAGDCMRRYEAEADALDWLPAIPAGEQLTLVGNSVWFDRNWIEEHMPILFSRFDRRLLDISSLNQFARLFAPNTFKSRPHPDAKLQHRALYDAQQSLATLRHYATAFCINPRQLVENTLGYGL